SCVRRPVPPLREAASFPWKQPSRLFVLLQIYGGVTDLDGCSSPRAARYCRGGEFWKVISPQICECSRLQDLRWLSILKPLRRSGSHSASATMKSTLVSADFVRRAPVRTGGGSYVHIRRAISHTLSSLRLSSSMERPFPTIEEAKPHCGL